MNFDPMELLRIAAEQSSNPVVAAFYLFLIIQSAVTLGLVGKPKAEPGQDEQKKVRDIQKQIANVLLASLVGGVEWGASLESLYFAITISLLAALYHKIWTWGLRDGVFDFVWQYLKVRLPYNIEPKSYAGAAKPVESRGLKPRED